MEKLIINISRRFKELQSVSVTDIFGGRFIDTVARNGGPFEPRDWRRYRDDTWDIEWGRGGMLKWRD